MNIRDTFGVKFNEMFSQNEQAVNELLIELATFFYKIDKRVSLEEQEYMENLMAGLKWTSPTNIETYQSGCIARVNKIDSAPESEVYSYLTKLMESLEKVDGVAQAKEIAREISDADGEIADDEVKYLKFIKAFG